MLSNLTVRPFVCVRVPGKDNPDNRLPRTVTGGLSEITRHALAADITMGVRVMSVDDWAEYHLVPFGISETDCQDKKLETLSGLDTTAVYDRTEQYPATTALGCRALKRLPAAYGVDVCTLDPQPLGDSPPLIYRLTATAQQPLTCDGHGSNPVTELLEIATSRAEPFMLYVEIRPIENGCTVRLWIATYKRSRQVLGWTDVAAQFEADNVLDPARLFDDDHLISTPTALKQAGWEPHKLESNWGDRHTNRLCRTADTNKQAATELVEAFHTPTAEYHRALGGPDRLDVDKAYSDLGMHPKIVLDRDSLHKVLGMVPGTRTPQQWNRCPDRASPRVTVHNQLREVGPRSYSTTTDPGKSSFLDF